MSPGVWGKYRLERRLGGGGMAEVFEGSSVGAEGFSRKVAIKRVLPGHSDNTRFAQMFIAEAQISARLVHPNVVSVLDFDRDAEGRLFLVMELVDGKDLDELVATGRLPVPVVVFIVAEILRGLGFAHDLPTGSGMRGVVHRDVSPHNILLSWEGAVKVTDFGIAKVRAASAATASAFIKGKPAYMSPEQANAQALDGRSDLFAVGIMLWEMLCGRRLFVAEDTRATIAAVLFGQIPRPRTVRADIPKDLERVTMKMLERDLSARYATAEAALADLMSCADAPRTGREALVAVLAERFPDSAPVRQSIAHARSATPTPLPRTLPGYHAHTVTDTAASVSPAIAMPGLGTVMSATTGTIAPPRHRWSPLLVLLVTAIASGVVAFVIVSAITSPTAQLPAPTLRDPARDIQTPPALADAGAAIRAIDDAAPHAAPSSTPTPADLGIRDARSGTASPDATAAQKPGAIGMQSTHARATRSGQLHVVGVPILTITVDGKLHGDSPRTITLPVGRHRVRLRNAQNHIDELLPAVIIRENETTTIDRMPK
jgi:eukaryotic-like serine/threonine-protein kinase